MNAPFKVIAAGADLPSVFAQVREREARMRNEGLSTEGESAGARWAIDTLEEMLGADAKRACVFSDDIHDLTIGSTRGG